MFDEDVREEFVKVFGIEPSTGHVTSDKTSRLRRKRKNEAKSKPKAF